MDAPDLQQPFSTPSAPPSGVRQRYAPWWLCAFLALALVGVLLLWRPWSTAFHSADRTVRVSGQSSVKAEPDEYVFMPSYEFNNADKTAGLAELTQKSDQVVNGLKKIGVADTDITTNASGYRDYYMYDEQTKTHTYALTVSAIASSREQAQKVQDYLLTTSPSGEVTPQLRFSEAKRKQLEGKGRDAAAKEARAKAEQQAKNLGFRVGDVKSIEDNGESFGGYPVPMMDATTSSAGRSAAVPSLPVQPGQNEFTYTISVTYYIR